MSSAAPKIARVGDKWRWVKPDVYPLLAAVGAGLTCTFYSFYLNLTTNPDVRVSKERRSTDAAAEFKGMDKEGKKYTKNLYRKLGSLGSP